MRYIVILRATVTGTAVRWTLPPSSLDALLQDVTLHYRRQIASVTIVGVTGD